MVHLCIHDKRCKLLILMITGLVARTTYVNYEFKLDHYSFLSRNFSIK